MENKNYKYVYVQNKLNNSGAVKITDGIYDGLIVDFGKVQFKEELNTNEMRLLFEYNVHNTPKIHADDWEDGELVDFLGGVLINIIEDKIESGNVDEFINPEETNEES